MRGGGVSFLKIGTYLPPFPRLRDHSTYLPPTDLALKIRLFSVKSRIFGPPVAGGVPTYLPSQETQRPTLHTPFFYGYILQKITQV